VWVRGVESTTPPMRQEARRVAHPSPAISSHQRIIAKHSLLLLLWFRSLQSRPQFYEKPAAKN
jgi:hypothetical protein